MVIFDFGDHSPYIYSAYFISIAVIALLISVRAAKLSKARASEVRDVEPTEKE